ncbi:MAG: response regulator, partial [Chloroflexota bacterium]
MNDNELIRIVMADDDEDDRILAQAAFEESALRNAVDFVEDGEELMAYLRREGPYEHLRNTPLPGLVLLDLNMPRKDGREVLQEIRSDERLKRIPVVVLTTSQQQEDVIRSYGLGANSYITKPVTFDGLV